MGDLVDLTTSGGKGRKCGQCTACCTTHGIRELDKPAFELCPHVCRMGCQIYDDRPPSCAGYECAWLQGMFANKDRPDLSGLVVEMQNTRLGWTWVVHEFWKGGHERGRGLALVEKLRMTKFPVCTVLQDGRRKVFSKDPYQIRTMQELLRTKTLSDNHELDS